MCDFPMCVSGNHDLSSSFRSLVLWAFLFECLGLRCVAQILLPRRELFSVDSGREQALRLLFRDAGRDHDPIPRLVWEKK